VLRHIQIRVTDHALDRRQVDPQRLHLADIGVAAGMRLSLRTSSTALTYSLNLSR
jgi:hypothetical protein